jgi:hypothetical protein
MMQIQQANSTVELEAVQRKAYELWVQGGCREGVAEQNWNEAERLVQAMQPQRAATPAPASERLVQATQQQPQRAATPAPASDPPSAPHTSSSSPVAHTNGKKSMKHH